MQMDPLCPLPRLGLGRALTPQEGTGSQLWLQDFEKIPPPFRPHFLRFLCLQAQHLSLRSFSLFLNEQILTKTLCVVGFLCCIEQVAYR